MCKRLKVKLDCGCVEFGIATWTCKDNKILSSAAKGELSAQAVLALYGGIDACPAGVEPEIWNSHLKCGRGVRGHRVGEFLMGTENEDDGKEEEAKNVRKPYAKKD